MKKRFILIFLIILCLILFIIPVFSAIPQTERDALIAFYNSTDGDNWTANTNWRNPGDPAQFNDPGTEHTWFGVTCNAELTRVTALTYSFNGLSGSIPTEINQLPYLESIHIDWCTLNAALPDMSGLTNLNDLFLAYNGITGSVPAWLNNLTGLMTINLRGNQLSGPLPDLGNLTGLRSLDLCSNQLSGNIPTWLNTFTQLMTLYLNDNQFTGNIPDLSGITSLTRLNLSDNDLIGPIPTWMNNISSLAYIELGGNHFTGTIPDLSNIASGLHTFDLSNNQLTGAMPAWMSSATNIMNLYLNSNQISGDITWLTPLTSLMYLNLGDNHFSGGIPPELGNMSLLRALYLNHNTLDGEIPAELGNLTGLEYLHLDGNKFTGDLPGALSNLTNLLQGELWLSWNILEGGGSSFIDSKHTGDWQATQTVAPTGVTAGDETGTTVTLNWTPVDYQADPGGYKIYYSTTSGSGYSYYLTVTGKSKSKATLQSLEPGTTYYFQIRTYTSAHINNDSLLTSGDSPEVSAATVGAPLEITLPNGGEAMFQGEEIIVTWNTGEGIENVVLTYSIDAGTTWDLIAGPIANSGVHTWLLPNTPSTQCQVKVEAEDGSVEDTGDGFFTIQPPELTLTTFNNGDLIFQGTEVNIDWTSDGIVENVLLTFTTDGGTTWHPITSVIPNTGHYAWILPNTPSTQCKIRIEEENGYASDESDMLFTIMAPEITLTTLNGGDSIFQGTEVNIDWYTDGIVENVMLTFTTDGGTTWHPITSVIPNSGHYAW
ncbi:MAG: hypothetical protein GY757_39865, partial [bacterium]|nr:hypothetical protein [bacterium]